MDNGKISVRYARALLNVANEQHCEDIIYQQMMQLTRNYSQDIHGFDEVLSNPIIGKEDKIKLQKTAIGETVHPCLAQFLDFLSEKNRENKLFLIALKYQEMYRKEKKILRANLTTAFAPDDTTLDSIKGFVEDSFHCQAEIHTEVDPALIGGFILDIEHERMDASVAGQLDKIKKSLPSCNP